MPDRHIPWRISSTPFQVPLDCPSTHNEGNCHGPRYASNSAIRRRALLGGGAIMITIGLGLNRAAAAILPPVITLSSADLDEGSDAGTVVGTFSVENGGNRVWSFQLEHDAGGIVALSGNDLVVGAAPLDHAGNPATEITMLASDGVRIIRRKFDLNIRKALPSLPRPSGAKVVGFGHSFIQRAGWATLSDDRPRDFASSNVRGVLPWIRLRDPRFNLDVWHDTANNLGGDNFMTGAFQGIGGEHISNHENTRGTISRTPYLLSLGPDIVYLDIGTNDISSGAGGKMTTAIMIERLDLQLKLLRDKGIWVVIQTITDRGEWPEGSPRQQIVADTNAWIKAQASRNGVKVCDLTADGFNYPAFDAALFDSGQVHPNPTGAEKMASVLLPILQAMVSPGSAVAMPTDAEMLDDSISLMTGIRARFSGTGGTKGTGASGAVADGYVFARSSGDSTAACSIEPIDATFNRQVITFTPSGTMTGSRVEEWRLRRTSQYLTAERGIVVGTDWLEAFVHVELSPWAGWLSCSLNMEFYSASGDQVYIARGGLLNPDRPTSDLPLAAAGFSGWLRVLPFQLPAGTDASRWRVDARPLVIEINRQVPGTGAAKISRLVVRKASDPRPRWLPG